MRAYVFLIQFIIQSSVAAAYLLNFSTSEAAEQDASLEKCRLFEDGKQDLRKTPYKITGLKSVLLKCSNGVDSRVAIRDLKFEKEKLPYYLLVDPQSLRTSIERQGCFRCVPTKLEDLESTRFGAAVAKTWSPPPSKKDAKLVADLALVNMGYRVGNGVGSYLTADLCPSHKPLDRDFLETLATIQKDPPIALSVSGRWIEKHTDDLQWLKTQVADGSLDVVWMNHSYHHVYDEDEEDDVNFMRSKGTSVKVEVLRTERVEIENGLTPSVFFRFPGLISDEKLMHQLQAYNLIPIGTGAWLQHLEMPKDGTIMLVHANGNEPGGLARFKTLHSRKQIPLPLLPLTKAP